MGEEEGKKERPRRGGGAVQQLITLTIVCLRWVLAIGVGVRQGEASQVPHRLVTVTHRGRGGAGWILFLSN